MQTFNTAILSMNVITLAVKGAYDHRTFLALAVTIPMVFLAAQIGLLVFRRLSDEGFRKLLIISCFVLGCGFILKDLFWA